MKKFLIGCSIFVALVLLVGIGGSFLLLKKIKDSFPDMKGLEAVEQQLVARDGVFESEIMPLDGSIEQETLAAFVEYQTALSARIEQSARSLQQLMDEETEHKSNFSKFRTLITGGLDVARSSVKISGVADSLLLATGLSRGEAVYLMALTRYGADDFEPPYGEDDFADSKKNEGREKMLEVVDEFEEQFETRAFVLLANQRRELRALETLDPRQEAWLSTLDAVLDERPRRITNLKGRLQPWQLETLEPQLQMLRWNWPQTPAEYFLDLLPTIDEDESESGIQIEID